MRMYIYDAYTSQMSVLFFRTCTCEKEEDLIIYDSFVENLDFCVVVVVVVLFVHLHFFFGRELFPSALFYPFIQSGYCFYLSENFIDERVNFFPNLVSSERNSVKLYLPINYFITIFMRFT